MKIDTTFLRSKVARRIFFQFILCALFPIGVLAIFSVRQISEQLTRESEARLLQATRAQGMSIYERLLLLEAEMKVIAQGSLERPSQGLPSGAEAFPPALRERLAGMEAVEPGGVTQILFGTVSQVPALTAAENSWIGSGHTAIAIGKSAPNPHIFMVRLLDPLHPDGGLLVSEIQGDFLWGAAALPAHADVCIFDASNGPLFCSANTAVSQRGEPDATLASSLADALSGRLDHSYVTQQWEIFLKPQFGAPRWLVILGEPRSEALALLAPFKNTFLRIILLSVWMVTLLSLIQIRRNLVPLERLKDATQRMTGFNFGSPIEVNSGDEFQELAHSFNDMADRLSRQFQTLESINQIDRTILSSLDTEKIALTVLTRLPQIISLDCASFSVASPQDPRELTTYVSLDGTELKEQPASSLLSPEEVTQLLERSEAMLLDGSKVTPSYASDLAQLGMGAYLVLPLVLGKKVLGVITLGHEFLPTLNDEQIFQARQVADQVAVALTNARLIQELSALHLGTLTALARAIDAKSGWTSGHSERVTELALRIGRAMGLPAQELDILRRGGLLHDIGKIGVPAHILDKPGKLSPEEQRVMREHVRIGARILEPIPGFHEVLPIVLQHHEWYDGSGYPEGLAGEEIHLNARIFALADCYDALTSERPYRPGLSHAEVMELIYKETGSHFDPRVVSAFEMALEGGAGSGEANNDVPADAVPEGASR
jgi:putative nucleotidyltransferase with HDIG domain